VGPRPPRGEDRGEPQQSGNRISAGWLRIPPRFSRVYSLNEGMRRSGEKVREPPPPQGEYRSWCGRVGNQVNAEAEKNA
jgi:hypothetical protein